MPCASYSLFHTWSQYRNTKSRLFLKKIWYFLTHEVTISQNWGKCEKNTPFEKKIKEGVKIWKMEKWKMSVWYKLNSEQLDIFHFLTFSNFTPTLIFFSKTCDVTLFIPSDFGLKLKVKNEKLYLHRRFNWTGECFIFHIQKNWADLLQKWPS